MPLVRRDPAQPGGGPRFLRPAFRPEDYTAPEEALRLFGRWRGGPDDSETLLAARDSPFTNYVELERFTRDGATWSLLLEASREFAVEVEHAASGFGQVRAVPPRRAYELARARDALRGEPILVEE